MFPSDLTMNDSDIMASLAPNVLVSFFLLCFATRKYLFGHLDLYGYLLVYYFCGLFVLLLVQF